MIGLAEWSLIALFLGWIAGVVTVQLIDDRNYRRGVVEDAYKDAVLAEGRANQAAKIAVDADSIDALVAADLSNAVQS